MVAPSPRLASVCFFQMGLELNIPWVWRQRNIPKGYRVKPGEKHPAQPKKPKSKSSSVQVDARGPATKSTGHARGNSPWSSLSPLNIIIAKPKHESLSPSWIGPTLCLFNQYCLPRLHFSSSCLPDSSHPALFHSPAFTSRHPRRTFCATALALSLAPFRFSFSGR